ncbi:MAG: hypothetical protein ACXVZQ_04285 [Terriglobales bacterium]
MACHTRFELRPVPATQHQEIRLEEELAPAVLDACFTLWREYSDLSERAPSAFAVCEDELLSWYAELQYKTRGAGKCSNCRTAVRHALKVRVECSGGSTRTYVCLCTRCLVAEEALADRVLYRVAGRWIESRHAREKAERRSGSMKQAA